MKSEEEMTITAQVIRCDQCGDDQGDESLYEVTKTLAENGWDMFVLEGDTLHIPDTLCDATHHFCSDECREKWLKAHPEVKLANANK